MGIALPRPPRSIALVKLSAIGDVCHALPVVRTLQREWPEARFTWLIGRAEAGLIGRIPEIEFVIYDKRAGLAGLAAVRRALGGRTFDLLLHMQFALRASVAAALVRSPVKLGYDRERALDLQWLFTTHRIEPAPREHVMDGLFGFARALGVSRREYRWDVPLPQEALEHAARAIPEGASTLIVSPCSSHPLRNWRAEHYARVADHAARELGLRVLLCGGPSERERRMGAEIARRMREPCTDLIGRDTLIGFQATLARAWALLTPDSGPAHMATAAGVPVIGLYAATRSARSGPYFSLEWCVDRFDAAARRFLGRGAGELPWRTKIERPGVMDLIEPEAVIGRLGVLAARRRVGRSA
ncbi:MAG: glycosyltransferase family 9 protein [Steroidobacteraceae bacterium]